jgi:Protein of unknown function (DUF1573)
MKYLILSLIIIFFSCKNKDIKKNTELKNNSLEWSDTIIDLGKLKYNSEMKFSFIARNYGTDTIFLEKIEAECGCTNINTKPQSILPKDSLVISGNLKVSEDTGKLEKSIFIVANTKQLFYRLKIVAHVTVP